MTAGIRPNSKRGFLDRLPYGFDEGAAKLALAYQAYYMATNSQTDDTLAQYANRISALCQRIKGYEERSSDLKAGFKKYAGKGASFLSENSVIFGAAAAGAVAGGFVGYGPSAGIAATTAATFPQTFGNAFVKEMEIAGYDLTSPDEVLRAYNDAEFMKLARRNSYVHASKMSGAVFLAGHLAGYIYSAVAKPVASASASAFRSILPKVLEGFAERSAPYAGDLAAKGVQSATNFAGKKVVQRVPLRALLFGAAVTAVAVEATHHSSARAMQGEYVLSKPQGLPSYNRSAMYL